MKAPFPWRLLFCASDSADLLGAQPAVTVSAAQGLELSCLRRRIMVVLLKTADTIEL